jgi:hypothetical protein
MGGWAYYCLLKMCFFEIWRRIVACPKWALTEFFGMKIPVIFISGQVGHIHRHTLDHLIGEYEIAAFRRSEGWVQIGDDPIRNTHQQPLTRQGNRRDDLPS